MCVCRIWKRGGGYVCVWAYLSEEKERKVFLSLEISDYWVKGQEAIKSGFDFTPQRDQKGRFF